MAGGEVRYRLALDSAAFKAGVKEAEGAWSGFAKNLEAKAGPALHTLGAMAPALKTAATGFGVLAAAGAAAGAAIAAVTAHAISHGSALADMSAKTGASAEALQKLATAAKMGGGSLESVGTNIARMQKVLGDGTAVEAFHKIGLSVEALKAAKPEEAFVQIGDALGRMTSSTERASVASDIFGKSWSELLPAIKAGFSEVGEEAERFGIVLSSDLVGALDSAGDSVDFLGSVTESLGARMGATVVQSDLFKGAIEGITAVLGAASIIWRDNEAAIQGWISRVAQLAEYVPMLGSAIKAAQAATAIAQAQIGPGGYSNLGPGAQYVGPGQDEWVAEQARRDKERADQLKRAATEAERLARAAEKANTGWREVGGTVGMLQTAMEGVAEAAEKAAAPMQMTGGGQFYADLIYGVPPATEQAAKATFDWAEALENVAHQFQALGGVGSILGTLAGGIASIGAQLQSVAKSGGFGALFKGGFGGIMQGLSSALAIGGAALEIGKSLWDAFTSSPAEKAAKAAGHYLGTELSEEMGEAIRADASSLGLSIQQASLLSLGEIMGSSGNPASSFLGPILDLIDGIADGSLPASRAVGELGDAFSKVLQEAQKAGTVGSKAVVSILQAARAAGGGAYTAEMQQYAGGQVSQASGAMGAIAGLNLSDPAMANAAGTIFSTTFWASVGEHGLTASIDAMAEPWAKMTEQFGEQAPALLGPIAALFEQMGDEDIRVAVEGMDGLNQAFEGLSNAGYMTEASFDAFGTAAVGAFGQATAAGLDQNAALASIAPLLANIIKASETYGFSIDEGTQALIDQAEAAGIAFPEDPILAMSAAIQDLINTLRELHGIPPYQAVTGGGGGGAGGGGSTGDGSGSGVDGGPKPHPGMPGHEPAFGAAAKGGGGITINVNGAGSPSAVARQIIDLIRQNTEGLAVVVRSA